MLVYWSARGGGVVGDCCLWGKRQVDVEGCGVQSEGASYDCRSIWARRVTLV